MKKQILNNFAIFLLSITLTCCISKPVAKFTTDKNEYVIGESITIQNLSTNATKYKWTSNMFAGEKTDKDIVISADKYPYSIKSWVMLTVTNKRGKTNTYTKEIIVHEQLGEIMFYTLSQVTGTIGVTLESDNPMYMDPVSSVKFITQSFSTTPNCGEPTCVTYTVYGGINGFTYTRNDTTHFLDTMAFSNTCTKIKLF